MVVALCEDRVISVSVQVIDLSWRRDVAVDLDVRACEEFEFFKAVNHGVHKKVIRDMEGEANDFFALPIDEKKAGPPKPLGYGSRNIGFNGDTGELEYLLLNTNRNSVHERARTICKEDPSKFRY